MKNKPYWKNILLIVKDITTSPAKAPSPDFIKEDLKRLKEEFFQYNLSDYIDIYRGNHAMMKFIYHYEKYLEPELKKRCKRGAKTLIMPTMHLNC